eukprot:3883336-Prymnesium_polylepis.1
MLGCDKTLFYRFEQKKHIVNFYRFEFNLPNFYRIPTLCPGRLPIDAIERAKLRALKAQCCQGREIKISGLYLIPWT